MKQFFSISLTLLLISLPADAANLQLKGYFDFYYSFNWNQPDAVSPPTDAELTQPPGNNRYRIFDPYHDTTSLSLMLLELRHSHNNVEAIIDLGFGQSIDVLSPRDEVSKHLVQAYITVTPKSDSRLSISVGKMFTHLGYEVVKSQSNWNYSRSVLFGYAIPFWHVGTALRYQLIPDKMSGALFLYNENAGLYETNRSKSVGAQLQGSVLNDLQLTYNFLSGPEIDSDGITHVRQIHEAILIKKLSDHWDFATDIVYGQLSRARSNRQKEAEWLAWSMYAKYQVGSWYLSPRYEIYTDRSGASVETATAEKPALPQKLTVTTLTLSKDWGEGLEARLEHRYDRSSGALFSNHASESKKTQSSTSLSLMYAF